MKPARSNAVDIYNFFDYREYLNAVYTQRKKVAGGYSHRHFSREAGISSPNYLFRVLRGERNLTGDYIARFCKAFRLDRNQARYFGILVQFNTEKEVDKKESHLGDLMALRYRRGIFRIDDKKLKFFSKWYYPIVRELAAIMPFKDDYNLLSRQCVPRITALQAKNAVAFLLKTGFLQKDPNGAYTRTDPVISSGDEVKSTVLRKYHRQTLTQSAQALDTIDLENRDISSLTLSVSENTYFAIKREIQDFRKRLLSMAKEDPGPEMVCLAGFQLIPRSRMNPRRGDRQ